MLPCFKRHAIVHQELVHTGGPTVNMLAAGAVASLAAWIIAKEVLKRFHYVGYNHSKR